MRERSTPSLIIEKSLSWEAGLEDGICQTSTVFPTILCVVCICEEGL